MNCPNCQGRITTRNYDPTYEIYDCPKCGGSFQPDEIEEANTGTSPAKRRREAKPVPRKAAPKKAGTRISVMDAVRDDLGKLRPVAKAKKRATAVMEDEEALAEYEAEQLKPVKSTDAAAVRHRDEVPTSQVLEIWADEIEEISHEFGGKVNRLNAREFYAMNIFRDLTFKRGVKFRDRAVPHALCDDHAAGG